MTAAKFSLGWRLLVAVLSVVLSGMTGWAADHEAVLHSFIINGEDGQLPYSSLVMDGAGISTAQL